MSGAVRIIVTLPDTTRADAVADYLEQVAQQVRDTYLSGHVGVDHHWESEGLR